MSDHKKEEIEMVAEQVKLLFTFAGQLIPKLDILKELEKSSGNMVGHVMSAAPILMATGIDYEQKEMESKLHAKLIFIGKILRAKALLNLVQVLKDTEDDRVDFNSKQKSRAEARAMLSKHLGL